MAVNNSLSTACGALTRGFCRLALLTAATAAALLGAGLHQASAQQQDEELQEIIRQNLRSQVITLDMPLSEMVPRSWREAKVTPEITLEPYEPDRNRLRDLLLEGETESKEIPEGPYGPGTEYTDDNGRTLEVFNRGFVYHLSRDQIEPVGRRKITEGPDGVPAAQLDEQGNPIVEWEFGREEAAQMARDYLEEHFGSPATPGDINTEVRVNLKDNQDRVAIVDFSREFLGVPLLDENIRVVLDGEREVVTLSYFWSESVQPETTLNDVLQPVQVIEFTRGRVMQAYNNEPPLFTLFGMKLGYLHKRNSPVARPVWLMDLRYNRPEVVENPENQTLERFGMQRRVQGVSQQRIFYAVHATEEREFNP